MSEDTNKNTEATGDAEIIGDTSQTSSQDGPRFTDSPDPLAGVKRTAGDVLDSMEGKTVSMKTYVGTIIGVIVLMLLARCGG
jgi:hypothetical protein